MMKWVGYLCFLVFIYVGCSAEYTNIDDNDLAYVFFMHSSSEFLGYYYHGSDQDFHYFSSRWQGEPDKTFKIVKSKLRLAKTRELKTEPILLSQLNSSDLSYGFVMTENEDETSAWVREYRLAVLNQDEEGLFVGLQNARDHSALFLLEGIENILGLKLISGDAKLGKVFIQYQGVIHLFVLEELPKLTPCELLALPSFVEPNKTPRRGVVRRMGVIRSVSASTQNTKSEVPLREELKAQLEAQQMEAIRSGKPPLPLPIPLTPEMERQLVEEGLLPTTK